MPRGCNIGLATHVLHRDPTIYFEPDSFKPERFLGIDQYHPYAFVGFSAGPRNCIGQKFAMLELKSTLAKLLRAFEFRPVDGYAPILVHSLIMKSTNGIKVKLIKR